jgi:hypothetical protein
MTSEENRTGDPARAPLSFSGFESPEALDQHIRQAEYTSKAGCHRKGLASKPRLDIHWGLGYDTRHRQTTQALSES